MTTVCPVIDARIARLLGCFGRRERFTRQRPFRADVLSASSNPVAAETSGASRRVLAHRLGLVRSDSSDAEHFEPSLALEIAQRPNAISARGVNRRTVSPPVFTQRVEELDRCIKGIRDAVSLELADLAVNVLRRDRERSDGFERLGKLEETQVI